MNSRDKNVQSNDNILHAPNALTEKDCLTDGLIATPPRSFVRHPCHKTTPSPALLNPITGDDWRLRRHHHHQALFPQLALADALESSTSQWRVQWIDGLERKNVVVESDELGSLLRMTPVTGSHCCDANDSSDEILETTACTIISVGNIQRVEQSELTLDEIRIILKEPTKEGISQLDFVCSPLIRSKMVGSLQSLLRPRKTFINLRQRQNGEEKPRATHGQQGSPTCVSAPCLPPPGAPSFLPLLEERSVSTTIPAAVTPESINSAEKVIEGSSEGLELTLIDIDGQEAIVSSPASETPERGVSSEADPAISVPTSPQSTLSCQHSVSTEVDAFPCELPTSPDLPEFFPNTCHFDFGDISDALDQLVRVGSIENDDEPCIEEILSVVDDMVISQQSWEIDASSLARRKRKKVPNPNSQARRWTKLQNEMAFGATKGQKVPYVQTAQSWDEAETTDLETPTQLPFTSLTELFQSEPQAQQERQKPSEESEPCYDSDPEFSRPRRNSKRVRQAAAQNENQSAAPAMQSTLVFPKDVLGSHGNNMSDDSILAVVDVMKSASFQLLWHQKSCAPKCVQAWVERGTYLLNQSFVQPKFMWKPAFEPYLATERKINSEMERFYLLDIARIDNSPSIDRELYPLAKRPHCFAIILRDDHFLFQAQSIVEKLKIVFGLKILVARLASMLMVKDSRAIDEFFEPVDARVAGHAPHVATLLTVQS